MGNGTAYLQSNVLYVSNNLRPCRVECHATCLQVADTELLLVNTFFRHDDSASIQRDYTAADRRSV